MKTFFYLILIFINYSAFAQTYNYDWAYSLGSFNSDRIVESVCDGNNNVYAVGSFMESVDFDPGPQILGFYSGQSPACFLQKLDQNGNLIWAIKLCDNSSFSAISMAIDHNQNVIVGGILSGSTNFYSITDTITITASNSVDSYVCKLDPNGNIIWIKTIGALANDVRILDLAVDSTNAIYTTGTFYQPVDFDPGPGTFNLSSAGNNNQDLFIQKLDENGDFVWAKRIGNTQNEEGTRIVCSQNQVLVAGWYQANVDFDPNAGSHSITPVGYNDMFLLALSFDGNFNWVDTWGSSISDKATGLDVDLLGNIYFTGYFDADMDMDPGPGVNVISNSGYDDIFIAKLLPTGTPIWTKVIASSDSEWSTDLAIDPLGGVIICGSFMDTLDADPGSGTHNLIPFNMNNNYLIKLTDNGEFQWAGQITCSVPFSNNYFENVNMDNQGSLYASGFIVDTVDFGMGGPTHNLMSLGYDDGFLLKLVPNTNGLISLNDLIWNIYPNPSKGQLHLGFNEPINGTVSILTITGLCLRTESINGTQTELDLTNFPAGSYYLQVKTSSNTFQKLVIKE